MLRFRGGLVFKAHRLWDHSTLGSRLKKKIGIMAGAGELVGVQMVRAPGSRVRTEHALALALNGIYKLCSDDGLGGGAVRGEVARQAASAVGHLKVIAPPF